MKNCWLILIFLPLLASAQTDRWGYSDSLFSTYYHQRWTLFKELPQTENDIIFIGNSITDGGEWSALFQDLRLKNRGISGDISAGVLHRIEEVARRKPAKVFLMIGVNDLARNIAPDSLIKNILLIAGYLNQETPSTQLFVQSILPVNDSFQMFSGHTGKGDAIRYVNEKLKQHAVEQRFTYIDLHSPFCDENGKLQKTWSNDGLHLTGRAYLLWKHLIFRHIHDVQEKPALLPMPQQVIWNKGYFFLNDCKSIFISHNTLEKEGQRLKEEMQKKGVQLDLKTGAPGNENHILLRLGNVEAPLSREEAYRLEVTAHQILITANTAQGAFNGIQTLLQLLRTGVAAEACEINDWPAFSWRGYMVDVGRNYMSPELLKEQIQFMSRYKFNVFHLHLTEDIAWRLEVKQYPQLTAPENMLRQKGQYYTEAELQDLISYCKERYITLVPEIDMPGHSAAFRRAMKTDMQSDTGLIIVKNILKAFCETYDVPYLHIGADEVKITNKNFIPEVTALIQSLNKKVIGWQPGGNFSENTIRQLWMDDLGKIVSNPNIQYIDSRHLYLNHLDPLESVTTLFHRKICNKEKGDATALGGTICMWHDRAVGKEEDVLKMNPVYPGMLAFAERSWRGGGQSGWIANISDGDQPAFTEFENRLLEHKTLYFKQQPFPYTKQSGLLWNLFGPYDHGGDFSKKFEPEQNTWNASIEKQVKQAIGGTVVLRHWWAPLIKGTIDDPKENTTWYATTKIWSNEEKEKDFWIGFYNLSRSPASDSPPTGAWDYKGSAVWINGDPVAPPQWKRGGQKGNPEIPLIDEGYEYREPTRVLLKKGWNTFLVKAPIGSFKGVNGQNPAKWMFTLVPLE